MRKEASMKHRLVIILAVVALFQCSYYHKAFQKKSQYYTETEQRMLAETTAAITFSYGYDADVELDYVVMYPYTKQDFPKKEKALQQLIASYDTDEYVSFYEKMYYLKALCVQQIEMFKKNKEWKEATYIQSYLLPPLEEYVALLEKNVLQKSPGYAGNIEQRKVALLEEADREVAFLDEIRKRRVLRKVINGKKPK